MNLEHRIGRRAKIGVVIPSTNTAVEYDCQKILPAGLTWHPARFWVKYPDLTSDAAFLKFLDGIRETIPDAVRDLMTAEVSHFMMGMSAETFWGGIEGNDEFISRLREQMGRSIGLTTGANAVVDALQRFGAKTVSVLTPYQPVGDKQVERFFGESGFTVKKLIGLRCASATSIAATPRQAVMRRVLELDGDDVDAIVQVGTNLSSVDLFPALETLLEKPCLPINVCTAWHALRACDIHDRLDGLGRLLEEH